MKLKTIATTFCVGLLGAVLWRPPAARADQWDKKTVMTFNEPVEIPGAVLPKGKYVFKLLDSQSDRHIVEVLNARENHLYATVLAIPDYRPEPSDRTVVTFEERAHGAPEAVHEWFYPGDQYGEEFVYPNAKLVEVAAAAKPSAAPARPAEVKPAAKPPAPQPKPAPVAATKPARKPVEIAQAKPAPAAPQPPAAVPARPAKRLPKTASELPLLALAGLLCMGAGLGLRLVSRRTD